MDSEIEKYMTKQSQLEKHIEELFAEKKMLQKRISVLNECLSYEKIKQKISELENKQNILKSLESMVYQMKTEIKPLDYLKQLLQKQLMVSSLSTSNNDLNIEKQKDFVSSQLTMNSECAIETLDSLSDVSSEGSVMVLSEYDMVSDDEVSENTEKTITNKVMYDEALQMASSMHSLLVESSASNIESLEPSPNITEQKDDVNVCLKSDSKDSIASMDTSVKIKQLLDMYDVVKKKDLISCTENAKMKLRNDKEKIESIIHEVCSLSFSDETLGDVEMKPSDSIKHDNQPKLLNDSWVKIDTDKFLGSSMKSEQLNDIFQPTKSQKDYTISKENLDVQVHLQTDELCDHRFDSKNDSEISNTESLVSNNLDKDLKYEVYNSVCLTNNSRNEGLINTSLLNMEYFSQPRGFVEPKVNIEEENLVENDQLCCHSTELKNSNDVQHFQNDSNHNLDNSNFKNEINYLVCSDKVETDSSLLNIIHDCNEPKVNIEVKTYVLNDQLHSDLTKFEDICELKNPNTAASNNVDINLKNEVNNSVCLANNVTNVSNENAIKPSSTECPSLLRECNEPKVEMNDIINNISSNEQFESSETPVQLCGINEFNTLGLNFQLLNGIHQQGFQNLMTLQQQCISYCIDGRDVVLHSYPCTGKSTMCFISVLQRINTSLNECQAIILVPSLELALFTQKMIKSLGKFMNVSTCIGGTNVPRKVSPVPHVVISTPQGLCDMINCNSLSKDFIKMLVIDDAEEMIKSIGFFNKIRKILLFLKNDRQLIILSTSKLEEILDYFSDTLRNPEYIILPDEKPSLDDIIQYYVNVPEEWKFDALCDLYTILNLRRTIVYCNTWNKSLILAENLRLKTYPVSAVHSEMDSNQRHHILRQFQTDISRVLVTTELIKGEYFSGVIYVINYNFPKCPKNYLRRIFSCFNRQVKVINFITPNDKLYKENIETTLNIKMLSIPQDLTDFNLPSITHK